MNTQRKRSRSAQQGVITLALAAAVALGSIASLARAAFDRQPEAPEVEQPVPKETEPTEDDAPKAEAPSERDTYIITWAERIDAFNAGYPLEGYGATFAAAAYDNGVDPRYSPAIARVESGSGLNCTYSCNAWGWGSSSWSDWDSAIYAHVAGLAQGYGHTISYEAALSYNELDPDGWYSQVESCMYQIWESE